MADKSRVIKVATGVAVGAAVLRLVGRRGHDPVHAPGHRHKGPAPSIHEPPPQSVKPGRDQPWVRRSHSDSQLRRFRR